MRSGTSFFNGTVFKKTVARYWPVWAVYLVLWLVYLPLNLLMQLQHYAGAVESALAGSCQGLLVSAVIFAPLAAMAVFSHLYNSRSANFFGSLPVRREGLFLTHYLAGLAFLLVPDLIVGALTLLVGAAFGANCLTVALYWLLVAFGEGFFFYSFAVFCGMFAGHILALPAFYAIFNCLAAALIMMFEYIFSRFYYGYYWFEGIAPRAVEWLTPAFRMDNDVGIKIIYSASSPQEWAVTYQGGGTLAVYAGAALVLTAAAFLLYRVRRLETAGDVVTVAPMKPVFKYSVSFCAGLFFGWLTALILGEYNTLAWVVASVVWAVVGCFAAQMILDKSFRVFKKWKGPAVMGLVFCALFAVICFDLTGFETRIPAAADVESVTVLDLDSSWDPGVDPTFETDDPERIEDLIILHRAAVDQRDEDGAPSETAGYVDLKLTYHLKSGGTLTRSYFFDVDSALAGQEGSPAWALRRIYEDRALMRMFYGFDKPVDDLEYVSYENRDWFDSDQYAEGTPEDIAAGVQELTPEYEYGRTHGQMIFDGADARALLDAAKADFAAGRLGWPRVGQETSAPRSLSFAYRVGSDGRMWMCYVEVPETATETFAALERIIPAFLEHEGFTGTEQALG